jgi:WD40 repeat protein
VTQVYDLRSGQPIGPTFQARVDYSESLVLAPNGGFVAGRLKGGASECTIEIFDAVSGRSVRQIVAGSGKAYAHPLHFVASDRLLTMTYAAQYPGLDELTEYKVWDVRSGAVVSEFSFNLVHHRKLSGLSNGGRYLVFHEAKGVIGQRLVIFDLTTGKVAGDVMFQPRSDPYGQSVGIVFSPDGREFAMLWRMDRKPDLWGKVLVFDATTGKRVAEHNLGYVLPNIDASAAYGGTSGILWTPDGSGWLLFGHLLVDRRTGAITGRLGPEPKSASGPRRFLGPNLVTGSVKLGPLDMGLTLEPAGGLNGGKSW